MAASVGAATVATVAEKVPLFGNDEDADQHAMREAAVEQFVLTSQEDLASQLRESQSLVFQAEGSNNYVNICLPTAGFISGTSPSAAATGVVAGYNSRNYCSDRTGPTVLLEMSDAKSHTLRLCTEEAAADVHARARGKAFQRTDAAVDAIRAALPAVGDLPDNQSVIVVSRPNISLGTAGKTQSRRHIVTCFPRHDPHSPLGGNPPTHLGYAPPRGPPGSMQDDDFFDQSGLEWWNASVTEGEDNGWFPHNEALQQLILEKKADIGDLLPAVASDVTYTSTGTWLGRDDGGTAWTSGCRSGPRSARVYISEMEVMICGMGHLLLSGYLGPRDTRAVTLTRGPSALLIHGPTAAARRRAGVTIHTDNFAARWTRRVDLDDMFALVKNVGLHAWLAYSGN